MTWQLSNDWAVSRGPRNWILQERRGKRWRNVDELKQAVFLVHANETQQISEIAAAVGYHNE